MATYPAQSVLKAKLREVCSSESACDALAIKFGGQPVSCSHRVPQQAAFAVTSDAEEAAKCAAVLCTYVDTEGCKTK
jgi:hypothetical protein